MNITAEELATIKIVRSSINQLKSNLLTTLATHESILKELDSVRALTDDMITQYNVLRDQHKTDLDHQVALRIALKAMKEAEQRYIVSSCLKAESEIRVAEAKKILDDVEHLIEASNTFARKFVDCHVLALSIMEESRDEPFAKRIRLDFL